MSAKRYILREEDVGYLASSIAVQEADIEFHKDQNSRFYIAIIEDGVQIPSTLRILECAENPLDQPEILTDDKQLPQKTFLPLGQIPSNSTNVDLIIRLRLTSNIDKQRLEKLLYKEINDALEKTVRKLQDEDNSSGDSND